MRPHAQSCYKLKMCDHYFTPPHHVLGYLPLLLSCCSTRIGTYTLVFLRMKSNKKYLDQLVSETKDHTIRVFVKEKVRVKTPIGKTKHQSLVLVDEKGTEMWAKMFGVNVDVFKNIIEPGYNYDISNVLVRDVNPTFNTKDKQELFINDSTRVVRIVGESSSAASCRLCKLATVPRTAAYDRRFDIIAVVLHVEPPKTVSSYRGFKFNVSELYVIDTSCTQPVVVSVWNDLASVLYESLVTDLNKNVTISMSALRVANFQGFSLGTTMSTEYTIKPVGDDVASLEKWCLENVNLINKFRVDVHRKALPEVPTEITTIADVLGLKADDVQRGQLIRICAAVCDFVVDDIRLSLGCENCGRGCDAALHEPIVCVACKKKSASEAKMYFYFKAKDSTGTIVLAAYTKNAQKLFNVHADKLYAMNSKDRHDFIEAAREPFLSCPIVFFITPSPALLTDHNVIKWMLKDVVRS